MTPPGTSYPWFHTLIETPLGATIGFSHLFYPYNQNPMYTTHYVPLVTPCDPSLLPPIKLNANSILHHLRNYPDLTFPQLLADISRFGVRVGYEGPSNI